MLPEAAARTGFDRAGRWAAGRDGKGIRQLRPNLRVVTGGALAEPELAALTTRAVRSYARYWQEAFRLPTLDSERIVTGTEVVGLEHLQQAHDEGRGLMMALPHSGNWDAAGVWFIDFLGGPFMTVAERLKPSRSTGASWSTGSRWACGSSAHRRTPAELGRPARLAGRRRSDLSPGGPQPRQRGCRCRSSGARPPCPAGRRCWPTGPGRRSSRPSAPSPSAAGG